MLSLGAGGRLRHDGSVLNSMLLATVALFGQDNPISARMESVLRAAAAQEWLSAYQQASAALPLLPHSSDAWLQATAQLIRTGLIGSPW